MVTLQINHARKTLERWSSLFNKLFGGQVTWSPVIGEWRIVGALRTSYVPSRQFVVFSAWHSWGYLASPCWPCACCQGAPSTSGRRSFALVATVVAWTCLGARRSSGSNHLPNRNATTKQSNADGIYHTEDTFLFVVLPFIILSIPCVTCIGLLVVW
jgi:hypothetical protein